MKHHKTIWIITGIVVMMTVMVVGLRRGQDRAAEPVERAPYTELSDRQVELLVATMLDCVERDPQARRPRTRFLVESVAALAESGARETPETCYALGVLRLRQRAPGEVATGAEEAYRKAIELRPDWSLPYNGLGVVLGTMDRLDEAEAALRKSIELDPHRSRPHNDLAILLRHVGRLEEAELEARIALDLDPDDVANHNNYGNLLLALGKTDDAEREYKRAIDLEPDQPAPYYNLACLAARRGDCPEMLAYLNCAIVLGEIFREEARVDSEFDAYRDDPDFRRMIYSRQ